LAPGAPGGTHAHPLGTHTWPGLLNPNPFKPTHHSAAAGAIICGECACECLRAQSVTHEACSTLTVRCAGMRTAHVAPRQEMPNLADPSSRTAVLRAAQSPVACARWVEHGTGLLYARGVPVRRRWGGMVSKLRPGCSTPTDCGETRTLASVLRVTDPPRGQ
jgi:hypothetical protein